MRKNWPWIIAAVAFLAWFAFFESYAFAHPDRLNTLSHFIASVGARWPLSIWLSGVICGGLAAHFYWLPWNNPLGKGDG